MHTLPGLCGGTWAINVPIPAIEPAAAIRAMRMLRVAIVLSPQERRRTLMKSGYSDAQIRVNGVPLGGVDLHQAATPREAVEASKRTDDGIGWRRRPPEVIGWRNDRRLLHSVGTGVGSRLSDLPLLDRHAGRVSPMVRAAPNRGVFPCGLWERAAGTDDGEEARGIRFR
jgi:hypothetical protein